MIHLRPGSDPLGMTGFISSDVKVQKQGAGWTEFGLKACWTSGESKEKQGQFPTSVQFLCTYCMFHINIFSRYVNSLSRSYPLNFPFRVI